MFIKPFKVKSKTQLRSSDRKKLHMQISGKYTKLTDEDFQRIFPPSGNIYHTKIIASNGETVLVYSEDKQPMFFELTNGQIYPTLHALWLIPHLLPSVTTHSGVLPIMAKGANLMARGVVKQGQGVQAWGCLRKGEVVAVNLTTNTNACAMGIFAQSSNDLYLSGGNGVCVDVLHVFGDKLWSIEPSACVQIPIGERAVPALKESDFPALGAEKVVPKAPEVPDPVEDICDNLDDVVIDDVAEEEPQDSPDEVLKKAFLTALKFDGSKLALPLLTSTFYANHVQAVTPEDFNIKHTTFKKVTKFMQQMADDGFLVVREEKKGIEKIISINFEHPEFVAFRPGQKRPTTKAEPEASPIQLLTAMTKIFVVSDTTAPLFTIYNHKCGDGLQENEVEKHFTQYVKKRKLQNAENARNITLDELLGGICGRAPGTTENYTTILQEILSKMPTNFEMRAKDVTKVPNIQIALGTRKGNKKVTLVSNLEAHGIFIPDFANRCKVGVQASTTVTQTATAKGDTLLIQGNQVRFVHTLLTETYHIPRGKISGLELARKEPKKKK
uniref:Putative filamentous baseplate protein ligatin n=1 Tax=Nyssomyia neivai TaxID=330878 RepID=A0A1L8DS41_9DIPT